jgi:hypothetical protein
MTNEVPDEVQAQAAIKLSDNVRELIRKEVLAAFADSVFVHDLMGNKASYALVTDIAGQLQYENQFKEAVRQVIRDQLSKP